MSPEEVVSADLGEDESVSQIPEHTEDVDEPDADLSAEVVIEEAAPEEATAEGTGPEAEAEVDVVPVVSKEDIQKEIAALEEKRRVAQEKYERWRDAAKDARAAHFTGREIPPAPEQVAPEMPGARPRPMEDQFDDYSKYIEALTDWKVEQKIQQYDQELERQAATGEVNERRERLREKLDEGHKLYEDFEEVALDPIVPITQVMADILTDCENPAGIAYYLGKNLKEATQISRMTPIQAARAMAQIELKIAPEAEGTPPGTTKPKPATQPKKTTQAPAPITPIRGASELVTKDPNRMTNEEYRLWRAGRLK
jgi:hypothetical protein